MIKPGQVLKEFKSKKGNQVLLRIPKKGDEKSLMKLINSIVVEDDYILINEKLTLKKETEWLKSSLKKLKSGDKLFIVAVVDGMIVGNADVNRMSGRMTHVGGFGISIMPGYREEGIGTELAKTVLSQANKLLKLKMIELEAYGTNKRALNLYKNLGFKEFGRMPRKIKAKGRYIDSIYMYKEL